MIIEVTMLEVDSEDAIEVFLVKSAISHLEKKHKIKINSKLKSAVYFLIWGYKIGRMFFPGL